MIPKEKAKELMAKFNNYHDIEKNEYIIYQSLEETKRCALLAVDFAMEFITGNLDEAFDKTLYLFEVKEEIENL
jgi:hypothetical protein